MKQLIPPLREQERTAIVYPAEDQHDVAIVLSGTGLSPSWQLQLPVNVDHPLIASFSQSLNNGSTRHMQTILGALGVVTSYIRSTPTCVGIQPRDPNHDLIA